MSANFPESSPAVVRLHIGEQETTIVFADGSEPGAPLVLEIGSVKTSTDYFKGHPPTPLELELENAIMAVEDEVARARTRVAEGATLLTANASVREIALIAGLRDQATLTLSIEAVEATFDRLVAVSLGRPAAHEGLPANSAFAATLLILREFMHHLKFASITWQASP